MTNKKRDDRKEDLKHYVDLEPYFLFFSDLGHFVGYTYGGAVSEFCLSDEIRFSHVVVKRVVQ